MKISILISIIGFLVALIWLIMKPGWDSLIATITGLSAIIGFTLPIAIRKNKVSMKQSGGKGSQNYQAKGDINIHK